ncbi:fumble domain-containing protein [Ditylenchus destructor]|nr:fumble domain-containing protein [Ditylenchus destructor]
MSANTESKSPVGTRQKRAMSLSLPPMPWFGIDIGGTLTKLVYFEPTDRSEYLETEDELLREKTIHHYLTTNKAYGESGIRDDDLQLNNVNINGRVGVIHFIRFPTDRMMNFIKLVKSKGFAQISSTELGMKLHKADELESLIKGIEFVAANNADECYYYDQPLDSEKCRKVIWRWSSARCSSTDHKYPNGVESTSEGLQYPYVVISGSSIGGGFFQGLCCLLCGCETFEEAIELATKGDNKNIDKLVRDIYGSGYDSIGLPEDIVAASFGKITNASERAKARKEDLARSALVTTTNNIGSIALNAAKQYGNFLRVNPIAAKQLAYAMDFWSQGQKKALFLVREGYFGAVGCLDKLVDVTQSRRMMRNGIINANSNQA